jgi:hypothetical protein
MVTRIAPWADIAPELSARLCGSEYRFSLAIKTIPTLGVASRFTRRLRRQDHALEEEHAHTGVGEGAREARRLGRLGEAAQSRRDRHPAQIGERMIGNERRAAGLQPLQQKQCDPVAAGARDDCVPIRHLRYRVTQRRRPRAERRSARQNRRKSGAGFMASPCGVRPMADTSTASPVRAHRQ